MHVVAVSVRSALIENVRLSQQYCCKFFMHEERYAKDAALRAGVQVAVCWNMADKAEFLLLMKDLRSGAVLLVIVRPSRAPFCRSGAA
jgi:hypothetical protein